MKAISIDETFVIILKDIYTGAASREHIDNQVSGELLILRDVSQGDPTSPKVFTATIKDFLKVPSWRGKGYNIVKTLSELRLVDDAVLTKKKKKKKKA